MDLIDISRIESNGVTSFSSGIAELQEIVGHLGWSSHFTRTLKPKNEDIENETIVLDAIPSIKVSEQSSDVGRIEFTWKMKLENCSPRIIP
jgi:hypothetical protein